MSASCLIKKIAEKNNPSVAGLDPLVDYLPQKMIKSGSPKDRAEAVYMFNKDIIDALYDIVPAVKPQMAYYEMLGLYGMETLYKTVEYAKSKGLYVILDGKRNDIGSTAECYAKAYLDELDCDGITVNGYLGFDGVKPFMRENKSMFVLVKTSNKSSGQLQDMLCLLYTSRCV